MDQKVEFKGLEQFMTVIMSCIKLSQEFEDGLFTIADVVKKIKLPRTSVDRVIKNAISSKLILEADKFKGEGNKKFLKMNPEKLNFGLEYCKLRLSQTIEDLREIDSSKTVKEAIEILEKELKSLKLVH